jgi:hypothetical protein
MLLKEKLRTESGEFYFLTVAAVDRITALVE